MTALILASALARRCVSRRVRVARGLSALAKNEDLEEPPLVRLERAAPQVGLAASMSKLPHTATNIDLTIKSVKHGGHALLGANGAGKSLLAQMLLDKNAVAGLTVAPPSVQHVSFASHQALLQAGGSVYQALAQGNLNKAAQFLVVRFGLYPLLHQDVRTLSNGQIKKVLIVRALSLRPRLLILDNAFDGLDVPSRDVLKQLVSKTLQGFAADNILVQSVSAKNTAHTQVLLLTQRPEEIVDEISTVSYFIDDKNNKQQHFTTVPRQDRSGQDLLHLALGIAPGAGSAESFFKPNDGLPSLESVQRWWWKRGDSETTVTAASSSVVDMKNVSVTRNGKDLLHGIDWQVVQGQRWLVGGLNGAGKSTLSRLLARQEEGVQGHISVLSDQQVGWVSTELHMSLAHADVTVREILLTQQQTFSSPSGGDSWRLVVEWLGISESLLLEKKQFNELSQGEQRLVLIAAALRSRPQLLVLDEPCQGLDLLNRQKVLGLVERICQATDMGLIYITHHLEEMLPSVTHALHLKEGNVVFQGLRADYDPTELDRSK